MFRGRIDTAAMLKSLLVLLAGFTSIGVLAQEAPKDTYPYPIKDPFTATVITTPEPLRYPLPPIDDVPAKLRVVEVLDRKPPDNFWHMRGLNYTFISAGRRAAPLIFVIAGTGAGHDGSSTLTLARAFHQAGMHVITMSSPTYSNFIVSASSNGVPGLPDDDSVDLYRAMQAAYEREKKRIKVSEFYVTGYSLGGMHAAFVGYQDSKQSYFNFKKILMINPPVNLFNSVQILDWLVTEVFPTREDFKLFYQNLMSQITDVYTENPRLKFNDEFLYALAATYPPGQLEMKGLIGLAFRFSATNMIFSSDMVTRWGYLVPPDAEINRRTRIGNFQRTGNNKSSFTQYFRDYLLPYYSERNPGVTEEQLLYRASLQSIEDYVSDARHIAVIGNLDDIILAPGEVEYLQNLFGPERSTFFPRGGHLGNMPERIFLTNVVEYFQGPVQ